MVAAGAGRMEGVADSTEVVEAAFMAAVAADLMGAARFMAGVHLEARAEDRLEAHAAAHLEARAASVDRGEVRLVAQ
jgi:hypothetical protein